MLATFRPHVLVSDIGMPFVDGYSLIRQVRALPNGACDIPAIAVTAFARDVDREEAFRAGFQRHLTKPVDPRELVSAVAKLARRE